MIGPLLRTALLELLDDLTDVCIHTCLSGSCTVRLINPSMSWPFANRRHSATSHHAGDGETSTQPAPRVSAPSKPPNIRFMRASIESCSRLLHTVLSTVAMPMPTYLIRPESDSQGGVPLTSRDFLCPSQMAPPTRAWKSDSMLTTIVHALPKEGKFESFPIHLQWRSLPGV